MNFLEQQKKEYYANLAPAKSTCNLAIATFFSAILMIASFSIWHTYTLLLKDLTF